MESSTYSWVIRVKSYGWSLLSVFGIEVLGFLTSDTFASLTREHFGTGIISTSIVLAVIEGVKHIRARYQLGKARRLGAALGTYTPPDIF